jgi:hypothetical protein
MRNIIEGIKNFWRFRKVIWNYRWYDHTYFLDIQSEVLKDMSNRHLVDGNTVDHKKTARKLMTMAGALDRIRNAPDRPLHTELLNNLHMETNELPGTDLCECLFTYGKYQADTYKRLSTIDRNDQKAQTQFYIDLYCELFQQIERYWD